MYQRLVMCLFLLSFSHSISGRMVNYNKSGEELVSPTIYTRELKQGKISGLNGLYPIKNIPESEYTLSRDSINYETFDRKIQFNENEILAFDFNLIPQTAGLNEVPDTSQSNKSKDIGEVETKAFGTSTLLTSNNTEALKANHVENNSNYRVLAEPVIETIINELSQKIKDWMANGSFWEADNSKELDEKELSIKIESWMANGTFWVADNNF